MVAVVATTVVGLVAPASAATPPAPDVQATVWAQPGTAALDGIGTFVYIAPPPAPGPTQASPANYRYSLVFHPSGAFGVVLLGEQDGQKVAGFGLTPITPISTVPYDWTYGQIYYLLAYRLSATQWGAWVYDWSAATWSLIAVQTVPDTTAGMLPESTTMVEYRATLPDTTDGTCAYYPRTDALFYPPMGWRGGAITSATYNSDAGYDGPCESNATTINGWRWYTVGQTAP